MDEAHNLVERSREMYSAIIYKEDFLLAKKILKKYGQAKLMRNWKNVTAYCSPISVSVRNM